MGRLNEKALDILAASDIQFKQNPRDDIALVKTHSIALVFLPASDIPLFVGEGSVDLGITGKDMISEYEASTPSTDTVGVKEIIGLQYSSCKLQVQMPKDSCYKEPKDLIGRNVCTSFPGIARSYFEGLEAQVPTTNGDWAVATQLKTKIKYLSGSVEAACRLGVADGIIDIVGGSISLTGVSNDCSWIAESGDTMRAQGLRAIHTVLETKAVVIRSKHPSDQDLINKVARRIKGYIGQILHPHLVLYADALSTAAEHYRLCIYNVRRSHLKEAEKITPGKRAPTVAALDDPDWVAVTAMVEKEKMATVMDDLVVCGAEDILCQELTTTRYCARPEGDY
ncbi:MAG: hypothetical protein Q9221_003351 [Calogaya cf. arnoldii]